MTEDVLFDGEESEGSSGTPGSDLEDRIEKLEDRVSSLEQNVLPSIRSVETDNGRRFIVESSSQRWYKPETLKAKFQEGGD